MKKIYFLTVMLMGMVLTSVGQDPTCPTGPGGYVAIRYTFGNPTHCMMHVAGIPTGQSGWTILLATPVNPDGTGGVLIPQYGTSDFDVEVDQTSGSADFIYDCNIYFADHVIVKHFDGTTITTCQITSIGNGGALPIKLTSFSGRLRNDNEVTLDWTSSIEFESAAYEVQRSTDGKYFEKVGTLKAAGTSLSTIKYTFDDRLPSTGGFFYRLKQIDIDGKYEYSKVVYVNSKKGSGVISSVFPNPFKGSVQLIGATSSDLTPNNIQVYSIGGQRINYRISGANSILIDPSAPDGIYILKMVKQNQQFRLVKSQASGTGY